MINPLSALIDWWHDSRTPAMFGPPHRFGLRPVPEDDDDPFDIADDRRAELIALDNITDQLDGILALLEDIRNQVNHLIPAERTPR